MKKILSVFLILIMITASFSVTFAENNNEDTKTKTEEKSDEPEVYAEAALLVNPDTGKVIYEKNADKKMYPASTTKIMTAYLVLNSLDLNAEITASETAVDIERDGSNMGLKAGEILTVENLLNALLIQSANDAANVLAEAVSGSIPEFINLMNKTAKEIGMNNTNFVSAHGYHDDNHYTTAKDMAIIAAKAMENPTFAKIVSLRYIEIPPTNLHENPRKFYSRNALTDKRIEAAVQYSYTTGIKTGRTEKAGQCFVGSATRNGIDLISVVFNAPIDSPNRSFIDTKNMFEYAYSRYRIKTVLKGDELASTCDVKWALGKSHLVLKSGKDVQTLLPKNNYNAELLTSKIAINEEIVAPIKKGDELGSITYYYDGEEVVVAKLCADRNVSRSYVKQVFSYLLHPIVLIILGLIVVIILLRRRKEMRRRAKIRRMKNKRNRW